MLQLETMHESMKSVENKISRNATQAQEIGSSFLNFLTSKVDPPGRAQETKNWEKSLMGVVYQGAEDGFQSDISTLHVSGARKEALKSVLLGKLRYPGMEDREERIAKTHESTFQWIWEEQTVSEKPWSNFVEWLESDSRLYWITGKAGSGKSTLMKLICQDEDQTAGVTNQQTERSPEVQEYGVQAHEHKGQDHGIRSSEPSRCRKHLRKWSGDSRLVVATFFF